MNKEGNIDVRNKEGNTDVRKKEGRTGVRKGRHADGWIDRQKEVETVRKISILTSWKIFGQIKLGFPLIETKLSTLLIIFKEKWRHLSFLRLVYIGDGFSVSSAKPSATSKEDVLTLAPWDSFYL
jgi:hypothetical protein